MDKGLSVSICPQGRILCCSAALTHTQMYYSRGRTEEGSSINIAVENHILSRNSPSSTTTCVPDSTDNSFFLIPMITTLIIVKFFETNVAYKCNSEGQSFHWPKIICNKVIRANGSVNSNARNAVDRISSLLLIIISQYQWGISKVIKTSS